MLVRLDAVPLVDHYRFDDSPFLTPCLDVDQRAFCIATNDLQKLGNWQSREVQMTTIPDSGLQEISREAWKDRIFVLMGIVVLIAIICAVIL